MKRTAKYYDEQASSNNSIDSPPSKKPRLTFFNDPQNCGTPPSTILPNEILVKIFEYAVCGKPSTSFRTLQNLCRVCPEWRSLVLSTPSLWSTIDLSKVHPKISQELLDFSSLGIFQYAHRINFSGWGCVLSRDVFSMIVRKFRMLKSLSLTGCYLFDGHCLSLLSNFAPLLEEIELLDISSRELDRKRDKTQSKITRFPLFSPCFAQFLEKSGTRLRSLNISQNCIQRVSLIFKTLCASCTNLQILDMSNVTTQSQFCLNVELLQNSCSQLKVIRLGNTALSPSKKFHPGFRFLEELSIPCNPENKTGHNDRVLMSFASRSPNLKLLDIRGSPRITSECLLALPAESIQHLSIDNCTSIFADGLHMVIAKWRHSLIDLDACCNFHPSGIEEGIEILIDSDDCCIENVNFRGSSLSFDAVTKLVSACKTLRSLNLESCRALPRGTKKHFKTASGIRQLRSKIRNRVYLE